MKRIFSVLVLTMLLIYGNGCGIPGSPNAPEVDDSVTLRASVSPPEVGSSQLLGSSQLSSAEVFAEMLKRGTCTVNGTQCVFNLATASQKLEISKIPPAAAYEIMLKVGNLELKSLAAHAGRVIDVPGGISLQTTARYHLRKAYAENEKLALGDFADYEVDTTIANGFFSALKAEIARADVDAARLENLISSQLAAIKVQKTFAQVFKRQGRAFDFNGDWQGQVSYFLHNSAGSPALLVFANATANFSCSGSSAVGSLQLVPVSVVPLVKNLSGISEPSETAFAFSGTCDGHSLQFTRTGRSGPLAGKNLDSWQIFPVSGGLACRAINLDSTYNSGIKTVAGEFVLSRKKK